MDPSWTAGCPELRRDPVRQRVSPPPGSGCPERRRGSARLRANKSASGHLVVRKSAVGLRAPVADRPVECDVPQVAEDPVGLLIPLCCKEIVVVLLVGVTNILRSVERPTAVLLFSKDASGRKRAMMYRSMRG